MFDYEHYYNFLYLVTPATILIAVPPDSVGLGLTPNNLKIRKQLPSQRGLIQVTPSTSDYNFLLKLIPAKNVHLARIYNRSSE